MPGNELPLYAVVAARIEVSAAINSCTRVESKRMAEPTRK